MSAGDLTAPIVYREIPNRPGFRFGSDGSVQTAWTMGVKPRIGDAWKTIKSSPRPTGYSWIRLGPVSSTKLERLDNVVCEAFHGPRPPGTECIHCDWDRSNCRPDNLFWGNDECDTKNPGVEYRTIPEADGHEFGDDGSVWSYWATGHTEKTDVCRRRHPTTLDSGHLQVEINWCGGKRKFGVHVLICTAFKGPCPPGMECCHNDGVPHNNHPGNLRWDTRKSNIQDQIIHDVIACGERHGSAKLTEDDVVEARRLYSSGASTPDLAMKYGVSSTSINEAISGETWGHIPHPVEIRGACGFKLNAQAILDIRSLYAEGVSSPRLADLYGVSVPLITRAIRGDIGSGLPGAMHTRDSHARKLSTEQEEDICRMAGSGWSLRRLGVQYGVSDVTIANILKRH